MTLRLRAGFLIVLGLAVSTMAAASSAAAQSPPKPLSAEDYVHRGDVAKRRHYWDMAIGQYRQALRLDSKNGTAHYELGEVLEKKGDLQGALNEYRAAYSLDPQSMAYKNSYERLRTGSEQSRLLGFCG